MSSEQLGKRRVIFVGDVHGCVDEMGTLLRKCQYHEDKDFLVFNGDIINKGPKSVQVHMVPERYSIACMHAYSKADSS